MSHTRKPASADVSMRHRLLAHARVHAPWRRALPHRSVRRLVQGVELWMPWSHRLPDYTSIAPGYGQNLVEVAVHLARERPGPVTIIDIGANIGDSVVQILNRVDARVLAIEADPYYLGYLEQNAGGLHEVTIAPCLLTVDEVKSHGWKPYRRAGTTHFRRSGTATNADSHEELTPLGGLPMLRVDSLSKNFPEFSHARLIKSDTDGHDTHLIPALARAFCASLPVLFFEFDAQLTRRVSGSDAQDVWRALNDLGYDLVWFWSHDGRALARCATAEAHQVSACLLRDGVAYLDSAVTHRDDEQGRAAVSAAFVEK